MPKASLTLYQKFLPAQISRDISIKTGKAQEKGVEIECLNNLLQQIEVMC